MNFDQLKRRFDKPHITPKSGQFVCTGRGVSIAGATAAGAYIAWVRYVALQIVCHMEAA